MFSHNRCCAPSLVKPKLSVQCSPMGKRSHWLQQGFCRSGKLVAVTLLFYLLFKTDNIKQILILLQGHQLVTSLDL